MAGVTCCAVETLETACTSRIPPATLPASLAEDLPIPYPQPTDPVSYQRLPVRHAESAPCESGDATDAHHARYKGTGAEQPRGHAIEARFTGLCHGDGAFHAA
eukprot:scaffold7358_cov252-Pinguiococcus_pyrenoidosus.AAC.17